MRLAVVLLPSAATGRGQSVILPTQLETQRSRGHTSTARILRTHRLTTVTVMTTMRYRNEESRKRSRLFIVHLDPRMVGPNSRMFLEGNTQKDV